MLKRAPARMLERAPTAREEELRASICRQLDDLAEHAEAANEGVWLPGNETAEHILKIGIATDTRELDAEVAARHRRPVVLGSWAVAGVGIAVAVLLHSGGVALVVAAGAFALQAALGRKPKREGGPEGYIDPFVTPSTALDLAAQDERYTRAVLSLAFGKEAVDSILGKIEALEAAPDAPLSIVFRPGEHPGLLAQEVHEITAETLAMRVANLDDAWPALPFHVLYGDAGRGKTTLVKVLAQEIRDRLRDLGLPEGHFVEAFGGDLSRAKKLDAKIRLANSRPGSVLFVDEIHAIPPDVAERMYMMTDRDFRYQFEGDDFPTQLNAFTVLGATTDLGKLHPAFRSRAKLLPLQLVPPEKLVAIALGMPYPVEPEAAELAVARVHWDGMPRSVVSLVEFAREFAKRDGRDGVEARDVEEAIRVQQLDEWGLGPFHRDVVRALARSPMVVAKGTKAERTVHKLSETSLLAMAKVDAQTFREDLRPALMDRGFLVTTSGGQQLTEAGLEYAQRKGLAGIAA